MSSSPLLPSTSLTASSRNILAVFLVIAGLGLTLMVSLTQGAIPLSLAELQQALWHEGSRINQTIIWDLRLPRIVAALMVGSALGLSGALLQGMLRNGLADPFILGISAGAGLVAVAFFTLGLVQTWVPLVAWFGAIATTGLVYLLARSPSGLSVERLVLGGVAISSLFGAVQSMLLLLSEDGRIQAALNWLIGSLNGRGWSELTMAGPYLAIALLLRCSLARVMNLLQLGDDLAVSLGVSLLRSRVLIGAISAQAIAQTLALLPQQQTIPPGLTVWQLVSLGRAPHQPWWRWELNADDHKQMALALESTGLVPYRDRLVETLSGGERQRAFLALALAQSPQVLLLDEPTTYLDLRYQLELLELLKQLNHQQNLTIITILHDVNLAARFSDRLALLKQGKLRHLGVSKDVLTPEHLVDVFGIHAAILQTPVGIQICPLTPSTTSPQIQT